MTSELKPCPFCGGDAEIINDCGQFYAECGNSACVSKPTTVLDDVLETVVEDWNTRAAPSADTIAPSSGCVFKDLGIEKPSADTLAGLMRYLCEHDYDTGTSFWAVDESHKAPAGEYVLHSEAAYALDVMRKANDHLSRMVIDADNRASVAEYKLDQAVNVVQPMIVKRAEALEAELAQIKAQEPVAWMHPEARWTDVSKQEISVHCKIGTYPLPLYASPLSDSLKAENERYRIALEIIGDGFVAPKDAPKYHDEAVNIARAALNVETSNDKG